MGSRVSLTWLTGILDKSFPSQDPQTHPGSRLRSLTTLGLRCFQFFPVSEPTAIAADGAGPR